MINRETRQRLHFIEEELSKIPEKVRKDVIDYEQGQLYAENLLMEAMYLLEPEIARHYAAATQIKLRIDES